MDKYLYIYIFFLLYINSPNFKYYRIISLRMYCLRVSRDLSAKSTLKSPERSFGVNSFLLIKLFILISIHLKYCKTVILYLECGEHLRLKSSGSCSATGKSLSTFRAVFFHCIFCCFNFELVKLSCKQVHIILNALRQVGV